MRTPLLLLPFVLAATLLGQDPVKPIPRVLPPVGIPVPDAVKAELSKSLSDLMAAYEDLEHPAKVDAGVYLKAVEFALLNGEFYKESDFDIARRHLAEAARRIEVLKTSAAPEPDWGKGFLVRGYESAIDGSTQPYGLEIPAALDLAKPVPVIVWLHGRGDKSTDLYFIEGCRKSQAFGGNVKEQTEFLILHPFGRQCVGWKFAGETDVFEAIEDVARHYQIDRRRIILAGFSMGGAGAWHLGAHYTDRFSAIHPGAGFVDTKIYQKLTPEQMPAPYVQTLWGLYDVPVYARNFLNTTLVAYSGETDKQKEAADLMERALAKEGMTMKHFIGPGMGHKYHPESVPPILAILREARLNSDPDTVEFQTRTLRYPRMHWLTVTGLEKHWENARVSASRKDGWNVTTGNVSSLVLAGEFKPGIPVKLDGQAVTVSDSGTHAQSFTKTGGKWAASGPAPAGLAKQPGLQGPIDDAFTGPFLVVLPSQKSPHAGFQRWLDAEIPHFITRWRELMRGHVRVKSDSEVTKEDVANYHLVCWGDPQTNLILRQAEPKLPVQWGEKEFTFRGATYPADGNVPVMIYPNPLQPGKYLVLNSGLTFREGHDKTNSQQTPKLPDWAVIGLSQDPGAQTPGKVAAAGFFNEQWK